MFPSPFLLLPALLAAPPAKRTLAEAVDRLVDQYDLEGRFSAVPRVAPRDQPSLVWLREALEAGDTQPFAKGHRSRREALALLRLLEGQEPPMEAPGLREPGSQLRYWRWGARLARAGSWGAPTRQRWEDHLLAPGLHPVVRGFALRHALCFALAEGDEGRLAALKEGLGEDVPDILAPFQTAFALRGAFAPTLRLWALPDLAPVSVMLAQPGIRTVRIAQAGEGPLAPPPVDTLWIIPTREGNAPQTADRLDEEARQEAAGLISRMPQDAARIYLAPVRSELMRFGLAFFPLVLELDGEGRVQRVRMGDAALATVPAL